MPKAWHPKRWCNFCMSEDEKKGNTSNFYRVMLLMHQLYTIWKYRDILSHKD